MWPLASRMKSGTWTMDELRSGARSWTDCVVETVPPQAQRNRAANEVVFMGDSFRRERVIRRRLRERCKNRGNPGRRPVLPFSPSMVISREGEVYAPFGGGGAPRGLLCLRAASAGRAIRQRRTFAGRRDPAAPGRRRDVARRWTGAVTGDRPL